MGVEREGEEAITICRSVAGKKESKESAKLNADAINRRKKKRGRTKW